MNGLRERAMTVGVLIGAALAVAAAGAAFTWSLGGEPAWDYWAFCGALSLTVALAAALVAAPLPWHRQAALALWLGASGWLLGSPTLGVALGLGYAALALAASRLWDARDATGLAAALALFGGFAWLPRAVDELRPALAPAADRLLPGVALVAVFALLAVWHAARRRRPALPRFAVPAGLALAALAFSPLVTSAPRPERHLPDLAPAAGDAVHPPIVLLILDTVRADHLSVYGYERDTTPNLRRLLDTHERAVLFPSAHAPGTWTLASHASLFTGTIPSQHGIHTQSMFDRATGRIRASSLVAQRTLAEVLRDAGYRTAFVSANNWMRHVEGMERGFDWFVHPLGVRPLPLVGERIRERWLPGFFVKEGSGRGTTAATINHHLLRFLDACLPGPCFAAANYMEAHAPLQPSRAFAGTFVEPDYSIERGPPALTRDTPELREYKMARYDEEIRELDDALGRLFAALDARGVLDRAWLVVTADHGEAFGEHGVTEHGTNVYTDTTHIPLLVLPPAGSQMPPRRDAVSLVDVTATLAAIGSGRPLGVGRDLRDPAAPQQPLAIEFYGDPKKVREHGPIAGMPSRAVLLGNEKLIERDGKRELYQLDRDPFERSDRARAEPDTVRSLAHELPTLRPRADVGRDLDLSHEDEDQLRALGYIE